MTYEELKDIKIGQKISRDGEDKRWIVDLKKDEHHIRNNEWASTPTMICAIHGVETFWVSLENCDYWNIVEDMVDLI